jgi:hypothetical protein
MRSRFVTLIVAAAVFAVTFLLLEWHERQQGSSAAAAPPAPLPIAVPEPTVPAAASAVPLDMKASPTPSEDSRAVTPDLVAPPADQEPTGRQRDAARGARTR